MADHSPVKHSQASIARHNITGLVLAGGQGNRMGGADKGLLPYQNQPMALHALRRLAPQVGPLLISANRNLAEYAALGATVCPDTLPNYPGPLAGLHAGLAHCQQHAPTPWLVSVPCDTPLLPSDLVARLAQAAMEANADIALAATLEPDTHTGELREQVHPVFCLLRLSLLPSLVRFCASGQGQVRRWTAMHRCITVRFDNPQAFFNANTPAELHQLHQVAPVG